MGKLVGKRKQRYLVRPMDQLELTCLIYGTVHSSYECKELSNFGTEYAKFGIFRRGTKGLKKKREVNDIVQQLINELILQENEK